MTATIVPLTEEETREFMDQISEGYASGAVKPEKVAE